jgi:DNA ligase-1
MFKPMLAVDFDEGRLRFPYYATPKLDGIRCVVRDGTALTRTLKHLPNRETHEWFRAMSAGLAGFDGELIVGDPTAKDVFSQTTSGIMRHEGRPAFRFFVFDMIDEAQQKPFTERALEAKRRIQALNLNSVVWLDGPLVKNTVELFRVEETLLGEGFEGVMLREPRSRYKLGRSTVNENSLLKVKRFRDAEAVVVGVEERQHNANPGVRNNLGRTQRSSAKAGKVGLDTLGALVVQGAPGQPFAGVRFSIGTGMDDRARAQMWSVRDQLRGLQVKYRYCEIGVKDAPRFPVFIGFRPEGT